MVGLVGFAVIFVRRFLAVFQDMIPMPPAAADSSLELLLTNLWVGKGEYADYY